MPDTDAKLAQLRSVLRDRFFPFLPEPNLPGYAPPLIEQNKLTKSLAALAVSKLADVDAPSATASIVDGFDDNGIDAVHYNRLQHALILVQSKFKLHGGEPDQAEVTRFATGIRDLLKGRYERFNDLFQQKLTDIEDALDDPDLKIVAVLAHTGGTLSQHPQRVLDDLQAEVNEFASRLIQEQFTLDRACELLALEHALLQLMSP